jgi:hypothetical protein
MYEWKLFKIFKKKKYIIKINEMNSEREESKEDNETIAKETFVASAIQGQYSQHFILF